MDILSSKFDTIVKGIIAGFDRIVFKGMLKPIIHSKGMENFLISQGVLNKDFKDYAMNQSKDIVRAAEETAKRQSGGEIEYLSSIHTRKETLAHERQKEKGIKEELIGIWSCVESCNTFRSAFDPVKKYPSLRNEKSRCKHLYYYFDDPTYGFMSARLQTWLPYEIQIAMNGREWLRRSLDAAGCGYVLNGNKFLHIDDYELAQKLLSAQHEADYEKILNSFLPPVFPTMKTFVGNMSYYWTLWQSELAKDYIFNDGDVLKPLMKDFLRHALITGNGEKILHYFGSPVKPGGQPHPKSNPEILSRANIWYDGLRVRHWNNGNSVKLYNEHNVLRFEMTMNDPKRFKVHRHAENQGSLEPKKFMYMRKGIADINVRAGVSRNIINRFTDQMASVEEKARLSELLGSIAAPVMVKGKRYRAIEMFGKDMEFLRAIADPAFNLGGITNKELQKKLGGTQWAKKKSGRQLSGRIGRHLALLRKHGLIKKFPKQRKYALTAKGQTLTAALDAVLSASVNDLLKIAA